MELLEPLTKESGRDLGCVVFPGGNHGLVETAHGLNSEMLASSRLVPGLFTTIREWLVARGIAR